MMHLLLDTHVAIWSTVSPARIPRHIQDLIADPVHDVWVSVVVLWEIAIKSSLGRGDGMPITAKSARRDFEEANFKLLPVLPEHAIAVGDLPQLHGDPFDRLMLAQARVEGLRLITVDRVLPRYDDTIITW